MGVYCGDPGDKEFDYNDFFFECGTANRYALTTSDSLFTCVAQVEVGGNDTSTARDTVLLPVNKVEAETDYRWSYFSSDRCYSFQADPTSVSRDSTVPTKKATGEPIPKQASATTSHDKNSPTLTSTAGLAFDEASSLGVRTGSLAFASGLLSLLVFGMVFA